jgi:hypothetical protein
MSAKAGEEGDIALSKEQMLDLIRKDPALRESYRKSGLIEGAAESTRDPRMIAAEDRVTAAMGIGAHSSVLDTYTKARKDTLDEIRRENEKREGDQRHQATMAAIAQRDRATDERGRQFDEKKPIEQQKADAATTRANRPTGGGGKGGATTLREAPVERLTTQAETLRKAAKEATGDRKRSLEAELDGVLAELRRRRESGGASPTAASAPRPSSTTKNYSNLWK